MALRIYQMRNIKLFSAGQLHFKTPCRESSSKSVPVQENMDGPEIKSGVPSRRTYVWGHSGSGAMGLRQFFFSKNKRKTREIVNAPYRADVDLNVFRSANLFGAGFGFTVISTRKEGKSLLFGCGINADSQLGHHELKDPKRMYLIKPDPIPLPGTSGSLDVLSISCGRAHTIISTNEGVFSLGNNAYGQCGRTVIHDEKYANSSVVHRIPIEDEIVSVSCGQDHSLFLSTSGVVYSCGLSCDGQTGVGISNPTVTHPVKVGGALKGVRIVNIATKGDTNLALSDQGDIFGWGNNEYGQLGESDEVQMPEPQSLFIGSPIGPVKDICTGGSSCGLVNSQGQVYTWGYGFLGHGGKNEILREPTLVPEALFGRNEYKGDIRVKSLDCGMGFFAAVTSSSELYTWGRNQFGSLGLGHSQNQYFPFKVLVPGLIRRVYCGADHMIALVKTFT